MQVFMDVISAALVFIATGLLGWMGRSLLGFKKEHAALLTLSEDMKRLLEEHEALMESQRNQIKAQIVSTFQECCQRGYISPMELDSVNRMADSYFALGGNHYIHTIVKRMNEEMPIVGDPIPE